MRKIHHHETYSPAQLHIVHFEQSKKVIYFREMHNAESRKHALPQCSVAMIKAIDGDDSAFCILRSYFPRREGRDRSFPPERGGSYKGVGFLPAPQARGGNPYYKVCFLPAPEAREKSSLQCPDKTEPYREL